MDQRAWAYWIANGGDPVRGRTGSDAKPFVANPRKQGTGFAPRWTQSKVLYGIGQRATGGTTGAVKAKNRIAPDVKLHGE